MPNSVANLNDVPALSKNDLNTPMDILFHDIKNRLFTIYGYLAIGDRENAKKKMDELNYIFNHDENQFSKNKHIFNYFIGSKFKFAGLFGIKCNYVNNFAKELNIDEMDICLILGNVIDNAIEACNHIKDKSKRFIDIDLSYKNNHLYIDIINSIEKPVEIENNNISTNKLNKEKHGLGLKSINHILNKYNGELNMKQYDDKFEINIKLEN